MLKASLSSPSRRAWVAAGAPILALVLMSMAMALAMLWNFAREQDEAFVDTSSRLVESAWGARRTALASLALDYAVWNEAYLATTAHWDTDWVANNLYSSIADGVFVVRADGDVRHAWVAATLDGEADAIRMRVVHAVQHQLNVGALPSAPNKQDMVASTLAVLDGHPMIISVAPISPEEGTVRQTRNPDLPVDYLVSVDLVTDAELTEIGASVGAGALSFSATSLATRTRVLLPLEDSSGRAFGALSWPRQHPGRAAFLREVGGIIIFLLIVGALALALARKLVGDQVRAAAELNGAQEASRVKSEFIATMSHELRTPLNAIMGYAELIKEETEDGAPVDTITADADRVLGAAKHLSRLINDVLDQSRIDAGKIDVTIEPVNVAAILSELETLMLPLAHANGNTLRISVDEEAGWVHADPMRLQQCLINLAGNALKFTRSGEITVSARRGRVPERGVRAGARRGLTGGLGRSSCRHGR